MRTVNQWFVVFFLFQGFADIISVGRDPSGFLDLKSEITLKTLLKRRFYQNEKAPCSTETSVSNDTCKSIGYFSGTQGQLTPK